MGRTDFQKHLGALHEVLDQDLSKRMLQACSVLRPLSQKEMESVFKVFKVRSIPHGEIITRQGFPTATFFVVKEGSCNAVVDGRVTKTFKPGMCECVCCSVAKEGASEC